MSPSELHIDDEIFPILGHALKDLNARTIDLSEEELLRLGLDASLPDSYGPYILREEISIGGYLEKRGFYRRSPHFSNYEAERNIHLGVDIWTKSGTPIYAPLSGQVFSIHNNEGFADYGPTIILYHNLKEHSFFSLYGHLSRWDLEALGVGQEIEAGKTIGHLGTQEENGDWPPHVHVQLIRDMEENKNDYPGVCSESDLPWYRLNCPDPKMILC